MNKQVQSAILRAAGRYIRKLMEPVEKQLRALEERSLLPGPQGEPGLPGRDGIDGNDAPPVTDERVREILGPVAEKSAADWLASNPPPAGADGRDGRDGEAPAVESVAAAISPDVLRAALAGWLADNPPAAGRDGRDVTDDQVSEQVRAWLAANPPERGPEGPPGERGMDGAAGQDGRDGRDATDEQLAMQVKAWLAANPPAAGEAGTPGRAGERGIDGSNGQDGADGRDALEVDVLSGIDIERSYARRTYASHLGGIWVARQQTHGMEGWECIVNGYQSIEIDLEDERTLVVRSTFSDGRRVEKRHAVPMLIDRGVFKDGAGYQRGDGVTWGGSFWIAQVDKADSKPDAGNGQWRLAVKKGRDGKEGPPGRAERAPAPVKVTP